MMKLPIILSTMIAALAIPGPLASQNTDTPPAAMDADKMEEGKMDANKDAKMMEGKMEGKMDANMDAKMMEKKKMHHKMKHHKRHAGGSEDRGTPPRDPKDRLPYDERGDNNDGTACGGATDTSPVAGPVEQPGQKMR